MNGWRCDCVPQIVGTLVISGGFNIYLQVIEQAIYEQLDVAEALVIGISDAY